MTVVVVAGALANKPYNGGEAWVRLSWLLGLRRLGIETWFLEQIEPTACRDDAGELVAAERSANLAWFRLVTRRFGLAERAALLLTDGQVVAGADPDALHDLAASAALLINISGNLTSDSLLRLPRRRAYLDLDPGYTQLWHRAGDLGPALLRHDDLLTVGLSIHGANAQVPLDGLSWRAVPPPVVLAEWPAVDDLPPPAFTTVASWRGGYGRAEQDGHLYGQKAHQFRRFANVPRQSVRRFEAALAIHPDDHKDVRLLQDGGWELVDPRATVAHPDAFRSYVQESAAEFSPAQGIYVETSCGWFGDRTTRYLSSGRPAIIQDTGLPSHLPLGEGLLSFRTPEEAVVAVEEVAGHYRMHALAARQIAEEHFDSDRVVGSLLEDLV